MTMTRQPKARDKVLLAARRIVESRGAGHLTYDELAAESGVTRGGITYQFPTKDALLKGLLEHDQAQWKTAEAASTPCDVACPRLADLIGFIRSHTSQDDERRRFVSGMLSAAMHQPDLLDGCRAELRERYANETWDEASLREYVLRLAAIGLFWDELFEFHALTPTARADLVALLERLAHEWAPAHADSAASQTKTKTKSKSNKKS